MAPSHTAAAVAGVQKPSRQQCSLVPFFHTSEPSPLRQLSAALAAFSCSAVGAAPVCAAANTATGAARAADANSIATLFSFFIESPLEDGRSGGAKRPKSEARKPGKHPVRRALTADQIIVPELLGATAFWAHRARTEAAMLRQSDKPRRIELPLSRVHLDAVEPSTARNRGPRDPLSPPPA